LKSAIREAAVHLEWRRALRYFKKKAMRWLTVPGRKGRFRHDVKVLITGAVSL